MAKQRILTFKKLEPSHFVGFFCLRHYLDYGWINQLIISALMKMNYFYKMFSLKYFKQFKYIYSNNQMQTFALLCVYSSVKKNKQLSLDYDRIIMYGCKSDTMNCFPLFTCTFLSVPFKRGGAPVLTLSPGLSAALREG